MVLSAQMTNDDGCTSGDHRLQINEHCCFCVGRSAEIVGYADEQFSSVGGEMARDVGYRGGCF